MRSGYRHGEAVVAACSLALRAALGVGVVAKPDMGSLAGYVRAWHLEQTEASVCGGFGVRTPRHRGPQRPGVAATGLVDVDGGVPHWWRSGRTGTDCHPRGRRPRRSCGCTGRRCCADAGGQRVPSAASAVGQAIDGRWGLGDGCVRNLTSLSLGARSERGLCTGSRRDHMLGVRHRLGPYLLCAIRCVCGQHGWPPGPGLEPRRQRIPREGCHGVPRAGCRAGAWQSGAPVRG